jgi:hypothetical protein
MTASAARVTLAALAAAGAAAMATAMATAGAASAAPAPLTLRLGEIAAVRGTAIRCVVTGRDHAEGILCSLTGSTGAPPQDSFAVALAAKGEAIVIRYPREGARQVWRVKASRGAEGPPSLGGGHSVRTVGVGGSWRVATTDIRCVVLRALKQPAVRCDRVDAEGPLPRSNSIAVTPLRVGIYRYDRERKAVERVEEAQPPSALKG